MTQDHWLAFEEMIDKMLILPALNCSSNSAAIDRIAKLCENNFMTAKLEAFQNEQVRDNKAKWEVGLERCSNVWNNFIPTDLEILSSKVSEVWMGAHW